MKLLVKAFWVSALISIIMAFGLYRLNILNSKPLNASNFSWVNKAEIYSLGTIMSVLAFPIYPEVARMHLMLYRPFDSHVKILKDDFFIDSVVVKNAIRKSLISGKPYRLAWPASAYQLSLNNEKYREARISLALNGGYLRVEDSKVIVSINIAYPRKSFAPLFSIPGIGVIGVEEGLFWVLQQEKWYHTGYVEWVSPLPPAIN